MYTIWVIQGRNNGLLPVWHALLGDHAIRIFGSLGSFASLVKFGPRRSPDLIVVEPQSSELLIGEAASLIGRVLGAIPLVVFDRKKQIISDKSMIRDHPIVWMETPSDPFEFNRSLNLLMTSPKTVLARCFRYKDLCLDCETLNLKIASAGTVQELPLKEAQLLRLFIEKAGICLSRDHIREIIWQGVSITARNIDSYVSRLRARIANSETSLASVYGGGYLLR